MNSLILFAQAAADVEPVLEESVLMFYINALGPFFGPTQLLISIAFVTLAIMNWLAITRNAIVPPEMIEQFYEKWEAKEFQEAYEIAKSSDSALGKILATGLVKMSDNAAVAEQAINDATEAEVMVLEHRLSHLATIAAISPMVGLLGTVWGMITAFYVIKQAGGTPNASELAGGISMALVTTQVGLLIAIPALATFEVLKNRLARYILELSVQTENVVKQFKNDNNGNSGKQ